MASRRIRLLVTVSEFVLSSQVRNLYDLLSCIDRDRFEVEVGALSLGDDAMESVGRLGFPIFGLRLQPTRPLRRGQLAQLFRGPVQYVRGRYDIVHSLLYQSIATEALAVRVLGRGRYVFTKSNLEWANHSSQWRAKCGLSNGIISISNATTALLRDKGFGNRCEQIPLGIDVDAFTSSPDKRHALREQLGLTGDAFVFGCAAQFIEIKEHLTAIKAFERLADREPSVHLILCGVNYKDDYYRRCESYVSRSRHAKRIKMVGQVADMQGFYSAIDVFVLPSRFEAFGYVYVEAMSCGRPAIACRAGGPAEIIVDGETGYLCNVSDSEDLEKKMRTYASHRELVVTHGNSSRRRAVEVYSKQVMVRRTEAFYLRTLGEAQRQSILSRAADRSRS